MKEKVMKKKCKEKRERICLDVSWKQCNGERKKEKKLEQNKKRQTRE